MSGLTFHATVKSAKAEDRLLFFKHEVHTELNDAMRQVQRQAVVLYKDAAVFGRYSTGQVQRSIRGFRDQGRSAASGQFQSGSMLAITASAHNPSRTYDYVGVTRFGHRFVAVLPRRGTNLKIGPGRKGWQGTWIGPEVRGWHPPRDWADAPSRAATTLANSIMAQARRRLENT